MRKSFLEKSQRENSNNQNEVIKRNQVNTTFRTKVTKRRAIQDINDTASLKKFNMMMEKVAKAAEND